MEFIELVGFMGFVGPVVLLLGLVGLPVGLLLGLVEFVGVLSRGS